MYAPATLLNLQAICRCRIILLTKFRDASATAGTLGYGGNDFPVIRYADIILNLAEASLNLGDNVNAIKYLAMVRARATRPGFAAVLLVPAYTVKYPTLKLAILHEKRIALAFYTAQGLKK